MALANLLNLTVENEQKLGISYDRIRESMDNLRDAFAFYREYPDLFVDHILKGPDSNFNFFIYQRIFLRIVMRHRLVYCTFPRAYSKSFLSVLVLLLRCILYPGSQLFVTTGGKEQAAGITREKVDELCTLIPGLKKEIDWNKTAMSRDMVHYGFKNGSSLEIIAGKQTSRGKRKTGGLIEETILVDQVALQEVIIPTMNVSRLLPDGTRDEKEIVNKSQIYVTTAGWKNSFAYNKLIQLLIWQILKPDEAMILGGSWRTPVLEGLLSKTFVDELRADGTFNEASFQREYESKWSGDAENAFFNAEAFDKCREIQLAEREYTVKTTKLAHYVIGVDVGRKGCSTEAVVVKVYPQPNNATGFKNTVNIFSFPDADFETQAIELKRLYFLYHATTLIIDGNGLGIGLIDYMVKSQIDPASGEILPPFGIENDDEGFYKKYITIDTIKNAVFVIKANAPINTEMYSYVQAQLYSKKIRFLIDQRTAKMKLLAQKVGQAMTIEQRNEALRPYIMTDILREQLLNLAEKNDGINIILKPVSNAIPKDKVSALCYAMYYIKKEEERKKKKRSFNIKDFLFMN